MVRGVKTRMFAGAMVGLVGTLACFGTEGDGKKGGTVEAEVKIDPIYRKYEGKVTLTEDEWKARLTPEQYRVLRRAGTEQAFCGGFWDFHNKGIFVCAGCGAPLFPSGTKFDSGTGWPSFTQPVVKGAVAERKDTSHGMVRTEVVCARCEGHLGHVFPDGPPPTGLRYCMNSVSMAFVPQSKLKELGYTEVPTE
jgi:peptide-methionine (R)-S-oxide reductase